MSELATKNESKGFEFKSSDIDAMADNAQAATEFLKAIAHEGRLMILCRLVEGECSVAEFEELLSARQAAVSQQLARLRMEGLVTTRRDGKMMYYSLANAKVKKIVPIIYEMFCS
ncbi:MAG: metalloregulator ArsR/SmtB family transcription factor [Rhizobiaceae bacterium]